MTTALIVIAIIIVLGALVSFFRGGGTPKDAAQGALSLAATVASVLIHLIVFGLGALAALRLVEVVFL